MVLPIWVIVVLFAVGWPIAAYLRRKDKQREDEMRRRLLPPSTGPQATSGPALKPGVEPKGQADTTEPPGLVNPSSPQSSDDEASPLAKPDARGGLRWSGSPPTPSSRDHHAGERPPQVEDVPGHTGLDADRRFVRYSWLVLGIVVVIIFAVPLVGAAITHHERSARASGSSDVGPSETGEPIEDESSASDDTLIDDSPSGSTIGVVDGTRQDGSTYTLRVEAKPPERISDLSSDDRKAVDLCDVDEQRDVVVPLEVKLTNTDSSFMLDDAYFTANLTYGTFEENALSLPSAPLQDILTLSIAQAYSDGPVCHHNVDESIATRKVVANTRWNNAVPAGESETAQLLLVIHDYYSPASPAGAIQEINDSGGLVMWFDQVQIGSGIDEVKTVEGDDSAYCQVHTIGYDGPKKACFHVRL